MLFKAFVVGMNSYLLCCNSFLIQAHSKAQFFFSNLQVVHVYIVMWLTC
jgi:hypothetical protein